MNIPVSEVAGCLSPTSVTQTVVDTCPTFPIPREFGYRISIVYDIMYIPNCTQIIDNYGGSFIVCPNQTLQLLTSTMLFNYELYVL